LIPDLLFTDKIGLDLYNDFVMLKISLADGTIVGLKRSIASRYLFLKNEEPLLRY
jgi:hypothetical protein